MVCVSMIKESKLIGKNLKKTYTISYDWISKWLRRKQLYTNNI